jgi:hypothetical protein
MIAPHFEDPNALNSCTHTFFCPSPAVKVQGYVELYAIAEENDASGIAEQMVVVGSSVNSYNAINVASADEKLSVTYLLTVLHTSGRGLVAHTDTGPHSFIFIEVNDVHTGAPEGSADPVESDMLMVPEVESTNNVKE